MTDADQQAEANSDSGQEPTGERERRPATSTAKAGDTGFINSITGTVLGTSVQIGNVHGELHIINEMPRAFSSGDALERLLTDLTTVHGDYLTMFDAVLTVVTTVHGDYLTMFDAEWPAAPNWWKPGVPEFVERLNAARDVLHRLRLNYEPVRVRVRVVAEAITSAALTTTEEALANAMIEYFNTPLVPDPPELSVTPARLLDDEMRQARDVVQVVEEAIERRRSRWRKVCHAYAALQVSRPGSP